MEGKLDIELFRFNHKTDYLSYYKKYSISYEKDGTVLSLLQSLKQLDDSICFDDELSNGVVINDKYVSLKDSLSALVKRVGSELKIEPLSKQDATFDLVIDKKRFYSKLSLIEEFFDKEDLKKYQNYMLYHFASPIEAVSSDFIGAGVLLFLADNFDKIDLQSKYNIFKLIGQNSGIWLYLSLQNRVFSYNNEDEKIRVLKNEMLMFKPDFNEVITNERKHLKDSLSQSQMAKNIYKECI